MHLILSWKFYRILIDRKWNQNFLYPPLRPFSTRSNLPIEFRIIHFAVTVAVASISQNTGIHLPPLLFTPSPPLPRAMCIHLAWLTFPPWSNIIAMELVSNVQTSIKSLCHKGPGRWREVTALSTPARDPGKEFTAWIVATTIYQSFRSQVSCSEPRTSSPGNDFN